MSKMLLALAALVLVFAASTCGGKNACEEAADKIVSCWSSADCTKLGMIAKAACEAYKKGTTGTGTTTGEASCEGAVQTTAEKINNCSALDPEKLCADCKQ